MLKKPVFSNLHKMDEQQQIKQLQEELLQLHAQVKQQQQQIAELYRKTVDLTGSPVTSKAFQQMPSFSLENFIGLRLIHLIGIVVLVIGLSIGVKYAIDRNLISETLRIGLAYAAGIILYFLSYRLKEKYNLFSAILFSGAMASLYFTTYAAFVYYHMMPFAVAFILMIALTIFSSYQAIMYDRKEIALLGLVGAYGIPFLISKNNDRADLFFLYILLINVGVVFLSIKKDWKIVGKTAQAITWVLFIGWASMQFQTRFQGVGFLFMSLFFLLFLFNTVAPKFLQQYQLTIGEVYQLVANNIALYISCLFLFGYKFVSTDVAFITLLTCLSIVVQAVAIMYFWKEELYAKRMLGSMSFILFVVFIALQWSGVTVTLLWLLTAVIIFAFGIFLKSVPVRMAAIVLMGITLLKLVLFDSLTFTSVQKIISYISLGVLLLVVSFFYQKFKDRLSHDE
jgi:uncharacterized membrane protein